MYSRAKEKPVFPFIVDLSFSLQSHLHLHISFIDGTTLFVTLNRFLFRLAIDNVYAIRVRILCRLTHLYRITGVLKLLDTTHIFSVLLIFCGNMAMLCTNFSIDHYKVRRKWFLRLNCSASQLSSIVILSVCDILN